MWVCFLHASPSPGRGQTRTTKLYRFSVVINGTMITRAPLILAVTLSCAYLGACTTRCGPSEDDSAVIEIDDSRRPFGIGGMNVTEYVKHVKPLFKANGIPVVEDTDHLGWIEIEIVGIKDANKGYRLLRKDSLLGGYHVHDLFSPAPPCECYPPEFYTGQ